MVIVEVAESSEVGVVDPGLMSVVTGGLVLVIVDVVVGVTTPVALVEDVGSMKLLRSGSGSLPWVTV